MKKQIAIDQFILWIYQDQKADIVINHGVGLFPAEMVADGLTPIAVSGDGCYQVEQNALLGTCVDYSGKGTAKLHPDAELAYDLLRSKSVSRLTYGVLHDYGKSGKEPDWLEGGKAAMVPSLSKNGKLKYIMDQNRRKRGCAVEPAMTSEYLDFKRNCYRIWWDALEEYRKVLITRNLMVDHELLPPSVEREPWLKKPVDVAQNI